MVVPAPSPWVGGRLALQDGIGLLWGDNMPVFLLDEEGRQVENPVILQLWVGNWPWGDIQTRRDRVLVNDSYNHLGHMLIIRIRYCICGHQNSQCHILHHSG
jgi:hypothetical protein